MIKKLVYFTPETEGVVVLPKEAVLTIVSNTSNPSPNPLTIMAASIIGGESVNEEIVGVDW